MVIVRKKGIVRDSAKTHNFSIWGLFSLVICRRMQENIKLLVNYISGVGFLDR